MIERLYIKNYAIIDELEIIFSKQLTIITGETGAGKSILLGALGLIMGKRADSKVLYQTENKCVVEAHFQVGSYNLKSFFEANDIDYDAEVIIRRELTPSGKSRAFINDTPVNLQQLKRLSENLIDLHQQFDTLDIHNVSFQMRMIDALAGNREALSLYQDQFKTYQKSKKLLESLVNQNNLAMNEMDFLHFQLDEFTKVGLQANEQVKLEEDQQTLSSAEEIKQRLAEAYHVLSEDEMAIVSKLRTLSNAIGNYAAINSNIREIHTRFEGIIVDLQDMADEMNQLDESIEYDPERLMEISSRLDLIFKLQSKHHVQSIEELLVIQGQIEEKINAFSDLSDQIEALEISVNNQEKKLLKLAKKLSEKRKKVIPGFEKKVHDLLEQLSMQHAQLKVDVEDLNELNSTGKDRIRFLFAANKGGRLEAIKDVASGGEISRLTLCTKSLVASAIPLPTLIFDEIDSGVSGDVALKMGQILHGLAKQHQVVSITHTPQIAAKADQHYFVYKKAGKDRTTTHIKDLNKEERIVEIATMLSGNPPSQSAVDNAQELLGF